MGRMISASQMKIFVVQNGLYTYFKYGSTDLQVATYDELQGGEFNFIEGHPSNVSGLLDAMAQQEQDATITLQLENLKLDCTTYANPEQPPEPQPPIEVDLGNSVGERTIAFLIDETLSNPDTVKVLQRYGNDANDLTPWHECGSRRVHFKQDTYQVFITNCNHTIRELKLVSPVGLTVV